MHQINVPHISGCNLIYDFVFNQLTMTIIPSCNYAQKKMTNDEIRDRVMRIVAEYDKIEPEKVHYASLRSLLICVLFVCFFFRSLYLGRARNRQIYLGVSPLAN